MGTQTARLPIIIVQGGQWGSEAKGLVAHKLTLERAVDVAIRTGTVNAGHTVYHKNRAYAMQQLPVSWIKKDCLLVLGPGAFISPEILAREIEWIAEATNKDIHQVLDRIYIDYRCGIHLPAHTDRAHTADRHHKIGTTGKGCSEAVVDKVMGRTRSPLPLFRDWLAGKNGIWKQIADRVTDAVTLSNLYYDQGFQLLVEGTQGTLLDLHLGDYPYTSHKQTQAASWLAEAGLAPTLPLDLWLVLRTYPIRVAGNSGPMPDEISWSKLARTINDKLGVDRVDEGALKRWCNALTLARDENWPECTTADPSYWTLAQREQWPEAASELHRVAFNSLQPEDQEELKKLFEFTTVTKKLRRVANWSWPTTLHTLMLNRPSHIALTFMNYKYPELWGAGAATVMTHHHVWDEFVEQVNQASASKGAGPVGMMSFGPQLEATHMGIPSDRG